MFESLANDWREANIRQADINSMLQSLGNYWGAVKNFSAAIIPGMVAMSVATTDGAGKALQVLGVTMVT